MTPTEIANGLSEGQRRAMLSAEADGCLGYLFIRWWQTSGPTMRALRRRGLGSTVWSGLILTPLGLAVRAHLLQEPHP